MRRSVASLPRVLSSRPRGWKLVAALAAAVLALVGGGGAQAMAAVPASAGQIAAGTHEAPRPSVQFGPGPVIPPPATPPSLQAMIKAQLAAIRLLIEATPPSGALAVLESPAAALDEAPQKPACNPLVDDARFWVAPTVAPAAAVAFLRSNPGPGLTNTGSGEVSGGSAVSYFIVDARSGQTAQQDQLVFSVTGIGDGSGIRADGQSVPTGANCLYG